MNENSMSPYGKALLDYFKGDRNAVIVVHRDDGVRTDLPVHEFYREGDEFSMIEQIALELCQGRVLDIGAGTGRHSLFLKNRGLEVEAVDVVPEAIEIIQERGIKKAYCIDIFEFNEKGFDSLLLLSHGIGITGTVEGLKRFLRKAYEMTVASGIILFDSLDVRYTQDPLNLAYHEMNKKQGRYIGEIKISLEYNGVKGVPFRWLHVIPETLIMESDIAGWNCEIVHREPSGNYLARLSKK